MKCKKAVLSFSCDHKDEKSLKIMSSKNFRKFISQERHMRILIWNAPWLNFNTSLELTVSFHDLNMISQKIVIMKIVWKKSSFELIRLHNLTFQVEIFNFRQRWVLNFLDDSKKWPIKAIQEKWASCFYFVFRDAFTVWNTRSRHWWEWNWYFWVLLCARIFHTSTCDKSRFRQFSQ